MQRIYAETQRKIRASTFTKMRGSVVQIGTTGACFAVGERGDVVYDVRESIVCGEDALTVLELAQAMVQSGREHRMIKVE